MSNILKSLNKDPSLTNHKQRENALERISNLEKFSAKVVESVDGSFKTVAKDLQDCNSNIEGLDRLIRAIIEVSGPEFNTKVTEQIKATRIAELEAQSASSAASVKMYVAEGKLKVADTVLNDTDILIVTQKDGNGDLKYPVRNHLALVQFIPAVKELLMNKKVGETVSLPDGGTVEILEVYEVVPQDESAGDKLPDTTFAVNPEEA